MVSNRDQESLKIILNEISEEVNKQTKNGRTFKEHLTHKEFQNEDGSFSPPTFQFKVIFADFSQMTKIQKYRSLRDQITDEAIDIGVLIVSTKFNLMSPFKDLIYEKELENIINVSLIHPIFMTKTLLPILSRRKHKSAIILVNS